MSRVRVCASAVLLIFHLSSNQASAQRATLSGTVVDRSGTRVAGASVTTVDRDRTTVTDADVAFIESAGLKVRGHPLLHPS